MQQVPTERSEHRHQSGHPPSSITTHQHGSSSLHDDDPARRLDGPAQPVVDSSRSPRVDAGADATAVDAGGLDEKLRGLSPGSPAPANGHDNRDAPTPGQRILDYENALNPPTPRQALGIKVVKRPDGYVPGAVSIQDFPNEILTCVLSHLHPDSHAAVALVSKRFYALMTTPHAWRMAFLRCFPAHQVLESKRGRGADGIRKEPTADVIRSETRYFPRLTPLATWRSEYLLRTRLLRSLERGKPGGGSGGIGSSGARQSGKRVSAVLTYNSKLPWLITNIHAVFANGKKPPRAVQGASDLGVATVSDPTSGKVERWGLLDPVSFPQLDEVMPHVVPYGLDEGPAAAPNVMDVSQPYGMLGGQGFPGGRAFFRSTAENHGRFLRSQTNAAQRHADIPRVPELMEGISSVWLAKSSAVPAATHSMIGMLTGSTLGVVTAYSLGWDPSSARSDGDMTAQWVLSPGVPITALKVDDNYSIRRRSAARILAVALNALGEVFYLTQPPVSVPANPRSEDLIKAAWLAGRTTCWHLLEDTRRVARPDGRDADAVRGTYSPRSSGDSTKLSQEQKIAEAREIEGFFQNMPSHFNKVCQGWDMRRRLEVDFANDDGSGAGEAVFVIDCGMAEGRPARVQRFTRSRVAASQEHEVAEKPGNLPPPSLFGRSDSEAVLPAKTPETQPPTPPPPTGGTVPQDAWACHTMRLKGGDGTTISASALDCSSQSCTTLSEDLLHVAGETGDAADQGPAEIPGRRARFLVVGTKSGAVLAWNAREKVKAPDEIQPVRIIQTDSPEISCVAATALYLVHGGSDGLVQAWEPLASTREVVRTLNGRSNGRAPRHMMTMNPALHEDSYSAVGAIYLDPDATVLRGIVSFGALMRYWTYSSTAHPGGRRRRARHHTDVHGRIGSRRQGGTSSRYIAAEEEELRREEERAAREQTRLRKRFGSLGDLTEEEAVRYAQMVSEESFSVEEELRRASTSDSATSASTGSVSASSVSEVTTVEMPTPEPEPSVPATGEESDYEQQIQQAIRLSLLEGVQGQGQGPDGADPGFAVKYRVKGKKVSHPASPATGGAAAGGSYWSGAGAGAGAGARSGGVQDDDEDLALALSLSMQDQEHEYRDARDVQGQERGKFEEFPPLETEGVGKGKGVVRW